MGCLISYTEVLAKVKELIEASLPLRQSTQGGTTWERGQPCGRRWVQPSGWQRRLLVWPGQSWSGVACQVSATGGVGVSVSPDTGEVGRSPSQHEGNLEATLYSADGGAGGQHLLTWV